MTLTCPSINVSYRRRNTSIFLSFFATILSRINIVNSVEIIDVHKVTDKIRVVDNDEESDSSCGLYIAKSTITNAGLGIFTGKYLNKDDLIGYGDPTIPIIDIDFHNGGKKSDEDYHWVLTEYDWRPTEVSPHLESEAETVNAFSAGMGAVPNCHFRLKNAEEDYCEYDTAGVTLLDPGIGAFTPYHNRPSYALEHIRPGQELFVDYGTHWFKAREDHLGLVPLKDDYRTGQKFLAGDRVRNLLLEMLPENAASDFWDMVIEFPYKSRPLSSLPKNLLSARRGIAVGIKQVEVEESIRPLWHLKKHGKCLDNITPGNSTIPHAGRGAFASRFISKGSMVAPAPLLHFPDRDSLIMYAEKYDNVTKTNVRDYSKPIGKQLLLNYCFGHKSSTLLLCPYGSGTWFINHNSGSPNVKIVWSEDPNYHNSTWLQKDVTFFEGDVWNGGMLFEYIALRDIHKGEEITFDYGEEWENAWKEHIEHWIPPEVSSDHLSPRELNMDSTTPLRTHEEGTYSDDIEIWCIMDIEKSVKNGTWYDSEDDTLKKNKNEFLVQRILERLEVEGGSEFIYTVEVMKMISKRSKSGKNFTIGDVPREAISFHFKNYKSELHIGNAFRHEIMIPDEMFPLTWRNLER